MKLSEIFREAQTYLWDGDWNGASRLCIYSCDAIKMAKGYYPVSAKTLIAECGCKGSSLFQFSEFKTNQEAQGARFMWLEMLALIADDEGL